MRYGFIKLKNDDGSLLYMEVNDFERYETYDVFKIHAVELVVYDNIYIGAFPLIFNEDEILKYNEDAKVVNSIGVDDICFQKSKASTIAKYLGCQNCGGV